MVLSDQFLDEQRAVGDAQADSLVNSYMSTGKAKQLYQILAQEASEIPQQRDTNDLLTFLTSQRTQPVWYNEQRIMSGQKVFKKYALDIMTLLGALSLPYCYAASPGNKALYQTEKMRKTPGKRLVETADFIINVLTPGNLSLNAYGHIQINKIRLIHAIARYYVAKGDWHQDWGLPINQEDMAGTNLAFSYIILVGLLRTGFTLNHQEQEDFLYVWRYIGYQMHIHDALLPGNKSEAATLEQKIRQRHFKASEEGKNLTLELINHYKSYFPPMAAYWVAAQMRYLVGPQVATILGMEPEPIKDSILKSLNSLKELTNSFYQNNKAYETMLSNHGKLKIQFMK